MRPSDVVSAMDLTVYPIAGLVIFLGVYALVTIRTLRSHPSDMKHHAAMALDADEPHASEGGER